MAKKPTAAEAELAAQLDRQTRTFVEIAAGSGMDVEEIALLCQPPITVEALKRDYAVELEMGPARANLETVTGLRAAVKKGNVGAMIYWTKARMGWTEKGPGVKEQPPDDQTGQTSAPAAMPTSQQVERAILQFPAPPLRRS